MKENQFESNQGLKHLTDDVSDKAESVANAAKEGGKKAKNLFDKTKNEIKFGLNDAQNNLAEYVKENPCLTLGISLVVGMIIGGLIRR